MIQIDRKQFSHAITLASAAAMRRSDIPALSAIKVTANGALTGMTTEKTCAIRISFRTGQMICKVNSPEVGNSSFDLPCEHNVAAQINKDFSIAFNSRYLLDICGALLGEEMEMQLTDAGAPTLIIDPADTAFRAALMPMRV
jgi:DNA polymerase-3 subunit beta